jgi:hypothetical protein
MVHHTVIGICKAGAAPVKQANNRNPAVKAFENR